MVQRNMEMSPSESGSFYRSTSRMSAGPMGMRLYHFAGAQTRRIGSTAPGEAAIRRIPPDCISVTLRFLGLLALVVITIASTGTGWDGRNSLPPSPLGPGGKLTCISYALFHGEQAPFAPYLRIPDRQIEQDLQRLSTLTSCVRTYSAMVPRNDMTTLAGKYGLEVVQGIWLGRDRAENGREIEAALELAHRHPGTVKVPIVGNETLLRGELPASEVKAYVEDVGRRSDLPVTYADVWEFWLKAPELASAVDFVAIHILPYWEDDPVSEPDAVAHVREVPGDSWRPFRARTYGSGSRLGRAKAACATAPFPLL